MNSDVGYCIPEIFEDGLLRSVASMTIDILKEKDILEGMFKKFNASYNTTLKEEGSAKSLKIMNQNYKLFFSKTTSSGDIKWPCSSRSAKKDSQAACISDYDIPVPSRTNRVNSSTIRKRLSFDVSENEMEDSNEDQMYLNDKKPSFSKHDGAKLYDSPKERFNPFKIPECTATLSVSDQSITDMSIATPVEDEMMVTSPIKDQKMVTTNEETIRTLANFNFEEKPNAWYSQQRQSFFNYETIKNASDGSDMYIQVRFNPEGKAESETSKETYYDSTKSIDNQQMEVTSPEKKDKTLVNDEGKTIINHIIDDRENDNSEGKSESEIGSEAYHDSTKSVDNQQMEITISKKEDKIFVNQEDKTFVNQKDKKHVNHEDKKIVNHEEKALINHAFDDRKNNNPEEKSESKTSSVTYYHDSTKYVDNQQMVVTSPQKADKTILNHEGTLVNHEDKTLINHDAIDDRKNDSCMTQYLGSSSSFFKKDSKVSNKHNTNKHESVLPNVKINSAFGFPVACKPPETLETSSISNKTLGKFPKPTVNSDKDETNGKELLSSTKDVKISNDLKLKKRKFPEYSLKATTALSLVTEEQEFMVPSKISKINNEPITYDEKAPVYAFFTSVLSSATLNDFRSSKCSNNNFIVDKDVIRTESKSTKSADPVDNCESMSISPAEKCEDSLNQLSVTQDCDSIISQESHQNKKEIEVKSDVKESECDKNEISAPKIKDVESPTDLMQNLIPTVKHSSEGNFQKSMTNELVVDDAVSIGKLSLQDIQSQKTIPPRDCFIPNEPSAKPDNSLDFQSAAFFDRLKHSAAHFSKYLHLFYEDLQFLDFITTYIIKLAEAIENIPSDNIEKFASSREDFKEKCLKITDTANKWIKEIASDYAIWKDCVKKINEIQQAAKCFYRENNQVITQKDCQKWKESFKILTRKADDMILLRDIRRPAIIQLGYEVEIANQIFTQTMVAAGILKHSSCFSSN